MLDALVDNVKDAIKSPESIKDSEKFGKSILDESFSTEEVKEVMKESSISIMKREEVREAASKLGSSAGGSP